MDSTGKPVDLSVVLARLEAIDARLGRMEASARKGDELLEELTPIARLAMTSATTRLDTLEKKGYFAFAKELVGVGERIVEGFSPEDVRQLGDAVVSILESVRAMTQPHILQISDEAADVLEKADQAEPIGLLGMVRSTRDADVQKGMAVMMEVMRHVGRVAKAMGESARRGPRATSREKLAAVLGPRRSKPLGVERTPAPIAPIAPIATKTSVPEVAPTILDGVAFGADGHLADPKSWTEALAVTLASAQGVTLDEPRWAVVRFARADFEKTGSSPNIRRLTQGTGLATKDLYALFPKAPGRTIAKIAGIPKPAVCI